MRSFLLSAMMSLAFGLGLGFGGGPAQAKTKDIAAVWVQQLLLDGYEEIEVSQTWLGRVRIQAEKGDLEREIIFNPQTGEVLRDYSHGGDGGLRLPLGFDVDLDDDDDVGDDDGDDDDEEDGDDGEDD
jgi:hypothetical protein